MVNLSAVDLNLLVALDALLSERSVTRAAQRIGLSQPAMSNALARLRVLLADPVMVRRGQGMELTARATELALPVQQLLADVRRTLAPPAFFDPKTSAYRFRVEAAQELELSLLPRVVERMAIVSPKVELVISPVTREAEETLRTGRGDLFLGPWSSIPEPLRSYVLHYEAFRCIARRGHPRVRSRLTLRAFAALGHVLAAPGAQPGSIIDTKLADEGTGKRVVVRTTHLHVVPSIVARTDLIATLPRTLARKFAEMLPLQVHRPPIESADYPIHMVWHPRTDTLGPHRWLRQLVMDVAASEDVW